MGYESQVQFVGVKVRGEALEAFIQETDRIIRTGKRGWEWMLVGLRIYTSHGYLDWNLCKDGRREIKNCTGETPLKLTGKNLTKVEEAFLEFWWDGELFPVGKWYKSEDMVGWLFPFCESGRILDISVEGDGEVWGWELDRKKGVRVLGLAPVTRWKKPVVKRVGKRKKVAR